MIVFDGVTKRYPDGTVAVDDLSLTAPTGQITVLAVFHTSRDPSVWQSRA